MFCGNCGTKIPDDSNVCPECGAVIKTEAKQPTQAAQVAQAVKQVETAKTKSKNKWIGLGVVVIAVVVVALVLAPLLRDGPEEVAVKCAEALTTGSAKELEKYLPKGLYENINELYGYYYDDDLVAHLDESIQQNKELIENEEYKVSYEVVDSREMSGNSSDFNYIKSLLNIKIDGISEVEVKVILTDTDGNTRSKSAVFWLAKIDGKWKLTDLSIYENPLNLIYSD